MRTKLLNALKQGYKNLGLSDEAFERVAAFGETFITEESQIANFVKGAEAILKAEQSSADKIRTELNGKIKVLEGEKAELQAKLTTPKEDKTPETESKTSNEQTKTDNDELAQLIAKAVAAAVTPLQKRLNDFESKNAAEEAVKSAVSRIDQWDYAKRYPKECARAKATAMELYEAYGKKWNADELENKIREKFNDLVADKGVDTSKPFDGGDNKNDDFDISDITKTLQKSGRLTPPKEQTN